VKKITLSFVIIWSVAVSVIGQLPKKQTDLTSNDRAKWFRILKWDEEDYFARNIDRFPNSGFTFYKLGKKKWLVEIVTGAGAYQLNYVYSVLNQRKNNWLAAKPLRLKSYYFDEKNIVRKEISPFAVGISSFDRLKRTITIYYKGSGLGYCGSYTTYKVINNRAQIVEARVRSCKSNATKRWPPPAKWPKVKPF